VGVACFEVAQLYESGTTVPRDPARALAFFEQACAAKHSPGCDKAHRLKQ
jgi:TPR repeat protein